MSSKSNNEKAKLVEKILALNPKAKVNEEMPRAKLREKLHAETQKALSRDVEPVVIVNEQPAKFEEVLVQEAAPHSTPEKPGEKLPSPQAALLGLFSVPLDIPAPAGIPRTAPQVTDVVTDKVVELLTVESNGKTKRYVSKTEPTSKYHLRERSSALKPCNIVHAFCEENPEATRKEVVEYCVAQGVHKSTAATQFHMYWNRRKQRELVESLKAQLAAAGERADIDDDCEE